jgi:nickel/cobalt transporter (NicO) family protein
MDVGPELLLIDAVAATGISHTMVPDHWVPIALFARQHGWSKAQTARAALLAGIGHVLFTPLIASVVWLAGVAAANRFGHLVDTAASIALIGFGAWIAVSAWLDLRGRGGRGHSQGPWHSHVHDFAHLSCGKIHGPELKRIPTDHGELELSIYEAGIPPRFRLTGARADAVKIETLRADRTRQVFLFEDHGTYGNPSMRFARARRSRMSSPSCSPWSMTASCVL